MLSQLVPSTTPLFSSIRPNFSIYPRGPKNGVHFNPKAALFSFCSALVAFNLLSVVMAALRGAHGLEKVEDQVSMYYMADEVAHTYRGLTIALSEGYWRSAYAALTPAELARELLRIAKSVNLARYRKHKRGRKKATQPMNKKRRNHISTARVLAGARTAV